MSYELMTIRVVYDINKKVKWR